MHQTLREEELKRELFEAIGAAFTYEETKHMTMMPIELATAIVQEVLKVYHSHLMPQPLREDELLKEFEDEHTYKDCEGTIWIEEQGYEDTGGIKEWLSKRLTQALQAAKEEGAREERERMLKSIYEDLKDVEIDGMEMMDSPTTDEIRGWKEAVKYIQLLIREYMGKEL